MKSYDMPLAMPDINNDLDLTFLNEIADGSDEFIVDSITAFLEQTPLILQDAINAINSDNWDAAARALHSLKANLGFFGMLTSQSLLIEIESACKRGGQDTADIKTKFSVLTDIINTTFTKLNEIKAEKVAGI